LENVADTVSTGWQVVTISPLAASVSRRFA
jgi:hypothetical protein